MPTYEYKCERGHTFEVMQPMSDGPLTKCEVCGVPVQRVFHPIAVHFKGSGFYNTDYGTRRRSREAAEAAKNGAAKDGAAKDGAGKSESGSDKKSDSKSSDSSSNGSSSSSGSAEKSPAAKSSSSD